jgi:hypothetical protein
METLYRIKFEAVNMHYAASLPEDTPNSEIPESEWGGTITTKPTNDPWDQYRTLKEWAAQGVGMVRNVRLEKATAPTWVAVEEDTYRPRAEDGE